MAEKLNIIGHEGELVAIFPDEMLAKLGVGGGDTIWLTEKPYGFNVTAKKPRKSRSAR
jgi:hypothetical protein